MTAREFRDALDALGLTLAAGGRLLGSTERTSQRWADGDREVPPAVERFLRFLVARGITAAEVHAALGEEITVRTWTKRTRTRRSVEGRQHAHGNPDGPDDPAMEPDDA